MEDGVTEQVNFEVENDLPERVKYYLSLIDEIEFGDESSISEELKFVEQDRNDTMQNIGENIDEYVSQGIINANDEDTNVVINLGNERQQSKRATRAELLSDMKQSAERYSHYFITANDSGSS